MSQPASSCIARRFVRRYLTNCIGDISATAELLVSELVTNAVTHASTHNSTDIIEVGIGVTGGVVRIEVHDTAASEPVVGDGSPLEASGRGMLIIDALSQRWGYNHDDHGKTVWLELAA